MSRNIVELMLDCARRAQPPAAPFLRYHPGRDFELRTRVAVFGPWRMTHEGLVAINARRAT